jgi:hypothetical protein
MVGLFLLAYQHSKEQFLSLCNIEYIKEPKESLIIEQNQDTTISRQEVLSLSPPRKRIFASSIYVDESKMIKPIYEHKKVVIDGQLAHKLMAQALPMMKVAKNPSILDILNALVRSMGLEADDIVKKSIDAVRITLEVILRSLSGKGNIIQEMPLSSWPKPHILVEGFADMVFIGDFVGVLEFKSSISGLTSQKSQMQVLAYAQSLKVRFNSPIKFALHLIGSEQDIDWQDYDENIQAIFLTAMQNQQKTSGITTL